MMLLQSVPSHHDCDRHEVSGELLASWMPETMQLEEVGQYLKLVES